MNLPPGRAQTSLATRRSLLSRLKESNAEKSWRQFFDTYWRLIYTTALGAGLTDVEAQEVVQETLINSASASTRSSPSRDDGKQ